MDKATNYELLILFAQFEEYLRENLGEPINLRSIYEYTKLRVGTLELLADQEEKD